MGVGVTGYVALLCVVVAIGVTHCGHSDCDDIGCAPSAEIMFPESIDSRTLSRLDVTADDQVLRCKLDEVGMLACDDGVGLLVFGPDPTHVADGIVVAGTPEKVRIVLASNFGRPVEATLRPKYKDEEFKGEGCGTCRIGRGTVAWTPIESGSECEPLPSVAQDRGFWEEVRIDGEWVEFFPTLNELAHDADVAAVADIVAVEAGRAIQGDVCEDLYIEVSVRARIREVFYDSTQQPFVSFSLVLPRATTLDVRDQVIDAAKAEMPIENVLLFLRSRTDAEVFRVVNGYGIWAATSRAPVDAPLLPFAPTDPTEASPYAEQLKDFGSMQELIASLR